MGVLFTNNASTTLSAAISSTSATSISVASSSTFPAPGAGEYFYATIDDGTNNEIVKVTAVSGTTWTVVRGSDNTTARTFSSGDTVQLRAAAALLTDIQQNIAAKSANQTVYNATTASSATTYNVGTDPQDEANAMVFLDGVMQHHDTFSFSGSTLTFDAAPSNGLKLEVIIDNLINLQSSNLTVDTFTATNGQTAFTLSDTPAAEDNLIVFIEGVFQNQDSYSISNNTLTMSAGVTTGRKVVVYVINPVNIGTPSDGTVTSAKLSGNITTPGTLTVGSYDVAFDSPTFVVDNSNSRVGLGTASPSVPVDIVGDVKMSSTLELTSHLDMPDSANVKLGTGDDLLLYHDGTNSYIANTTGALKIATETSGIAVTIGHTTSETTVADNLTVTGTITGTLATAAQTNITSLGTLTTLTVDDITINGSTISDAGSLTVDIGGTLILDADDGDVQLKDGGTQFASLYKSSNDFIVRSMISDGDFKIQGNDGGSTINALTLDMSDAGSAYFNNKVGIGTTSPETQLHIEDSNAGGAIEIGGDGGANQYQYINFGGNAAGDSAWQIGKNLNSANSIAPAKGFYFYDLLNSASRMVIDTSGNVGIGTVSPAQKLEVSSSSGSNIIRSTGTVADGYRHGFEASNTHTGGTIWSMGSTNNSDGYFGGGKFFIANETMGDVDANTAAVFVINGSGQVGIGTTSPSTLLHVKGGSASTYLRMDNSADGHDVGFELYQNGSRKWEIVSDDSVGDCISIRNNAGTEKFRFTQDGHIGVIGANNSIYISQDGGTGTLSTAEDNVGIGYECLTAITSGDNNTAVGSHAGIALDTGSANVIIGVAAGLGVTSSGKNVIIGNDAGRGLSTQTGQCVYVGNLAGNSGTGNQCVGIGEQALESGNHGDGNVAIGWSAGEDLTGVSNVFIGSEAGREATSADQNVCIGIGAAGVGTMTGDDNVIIGGNAGEDMTSGELNVIVGRNAGKQMTSGNNNTYVGANAGLVSETSGSYNTAIGKDSGKGITTGTFFTGLGQRSGENVSTGTKNTCIGNYSGAAITNGTYNVCIGSDTNVTQGNAEKQIVIGYGFTGNGDNKANLGSDGGYVWNSYTVNNTWTQVSDERTKKNINSDDLGLEFINKLRPVTFNWRHSTEIDPDFIEETVNIGRGEKDTETLIHGLIAQEVKEAMDSVDNTTFNGWEEGIDGQAISREMFITPLIKAVQELSAEIEELKQEIEALKDG